MGENKYLKKPLFNRRPLSQEYRAYIKSYAWRARRQRALEKAGFRCQVCGDRRRLEAHHVTYANLGHELDEDLTVLCWQCHVVATWHIRLRRLWRRLLSIKR